MQEHPIDRHTFQKTRHRGLSYRGAADGSKRFYGYLPGKGRVVLQATSERAAVDEYGELRGKVRKGEQVLQPSKLKVALVGDEWYEDASPDLSEEWRKDCRRSLDNIIAPHWGHRRICEITPHDVISLDRKLRKQGLAESTVANYLKPARALFDYAVLQRYIAANPFSLVPRGRLSSSNSTREHREWTTAEIQRFIEGGYSLDDRKAARAEYGLAIEYKIRTGARLGEILGAQYGDINFEHGVWSIERQWTKGGKITAPKTEKSRRRVPLASGLVKKIAERKLRLGAGDTDYIFASRKGGNPISHTNFRRRGWNLAVEKAELSAGPKVTPHDARHAFASEMSDLGLSSSDVAEVLGHTSATITEKIYTHVFNREDREERVRQAMALAGGAGA